ncbi:MAG: hypothetical protein WD847_12475 [Pirellulales bacterium]
MTMSNESKPVNDPSATEAACRYLRSKGMYVTGTMDPARDTGEMGDGNCWCNKTQNVLGPDDGLVDRKLCSASSRTCYQAVL